MKLLGIDLAISSPVMVLMNALLMASFITTKYFHLSTSNFLIMSLSLSDILNGSVTTPWMASIYYTIDLKECCDIFNTAQATNGFLASLSVILTFKNQLIAV